MRKNAVKGRLLDLWYCPTSGRVIEGLLHDDKVLCNCGKSNPRVPEERTHQTGTHIKRFLQEATELDWQLQRERDYANDKR